MHATAGRSYRWLFWTMFVVGLAADQVGKYWSFTAMYNDGGGSEIVLIPDFFSLVAAYPHPTHAEPGDGILTPLRTVSGEVMPAVNDGALWGTKLGLDGVDANMIFAIVSLLASAGIIIWSCLPRSKYEGLLCFALGAILSGAVGNFYDRIVFRGVRDFLRFHPFDWPVFNIADCCLVCGAGMLLLQAFFAQPAADPTPVPAAATEPAVSE